jgi:macrocin-O-methyltransferase TylF-like protien
MTMATPTTPSSALFDTGHYAASLGQRLRRGFELGPKYYLFDVPRYVRQRRKLKLPMLDWRALWNPVRSFLHATYLQLPLPPHYDEALELLARAGVQFTNPRQRTEALVGLWWQVHDVAGDVIECGAYRGATSLLLAVLGRLNGVSQRVLMLDTFAGMPPPSEFDSSRRPGEFAPPGSWTEVIAEQIAALGVADRVEIHQGLFADSFVRLAPRDPRFAFAHIDANIFEGTRDACEFTLPRMAAGGAVVFDDYNGLCDLGARLAIDVSVRGGERRPLPLAECSAYLRT